jgi:hypothetical protein
VRDRYRGLPVCHGFLAEGFHHHLLVELVFAVIDAVRSHTAEEDRLLPVRA